MGDFVFLERRAVAVVDDGAIPPVLYDCFFETLSASMRCK